MNSISYNPEDYSDKTIEMNTNMFVQPLSPLPYSTLLEKPYTSESAHVYTVTKHSLESF